MQRLFARTRVRVAILLFYQFSFRLQKWHLFAKSYWLTSYCLQLRRQYLRVSRDKAKVTLNHAKLGKTAYNSGIRGKLSVCHVSVDIFIQKEELK